jgi:hypothetical protein
MTMRCDDALKAMQQVLDGEASQSAIAELVAHTESCASCARAYRELLHWDDVLRNPDADEPDDAYFHAMANRIGASLRDREPQRMPVSALSWSFASALAAACLVFGLGIGHFAFPRTITETRTVVQPVPGPVREVEKVKEVPVQVPVEVVRWRTRTVTKVKEVPAQHTRGGASYVADASVPSTPAPVAVAAPPTETAVPVAAPPAPQPTAHGTYYASLPGGAGFGYRRLEPDDISALARRLSEDMERLDEALSAPRLASALVSDIETADAEIERAITVEATEADPQ